MVFDTGTFLEIKVCGGMFLLLSIFHFAIVENNTGVQFVQNMPSILKHVFFLKIIQYENSLLSIRFTS